MYLHAPVLPSRPTTRRQYTTRPSSGACRQPLCCIHAYSLARILAPAPVPVGPARITALALAASSSRPLSRSLRDQDGLVERAFQGLVRVERGLGRRLLLPDLFGLEAYVVDLFLEDESSGRPLGIGHRQTYIGQAAPWRCDEVAIFALPLISAAVIHSDQQGRSTDQQGLPYLAREGPHGSIGPKITLELLGDDFLENVVPGNPVLIERRRRRHLPGGHSSQGNATEGPRRGRSPRQRSRLVGRGRGVLYILRETFRVGILVSGCHW